VTERVIIIVICIELYHNNQHGHWSKQGLGYRWTLWGILVKSDETPDLGN